MNKLLIGCEHDGSFIPVNEVKRLMQEYGKYCAEIAFDDGFNLGYIENQRPIFEEWWSEFQRKEVIE